MDRMAALAYLTPMYGALATDVGLTPTDTETGYQPAIDAALRLLGTAEAALATTVIDGSRRDDYLAALDYATLVRILRAIPMRVDIGMETYSKKRSQMVANVRDLLNDATAALEARGIYPGASPFQVGRFNLDYLEANESLA